MKNQVRAFIAVELAQEVRNNVAKLIHALRPEIEGTKWVEPENLHVTLKFLGDVPLNELHRLLAAMKRAAEQIDSFDLSFHACGAFPNLLSPKTIWVGCEQGAENLARLAGLVEDELFKLGFPKENRRFSAHLTIGRMKKSLPGEASTVSQVLLEQENRSFGACGIDEIVLYSSELTRRGPIYDVLGTAALR